MPHNTVQSLISLGVKGQKNYLVKLSKALFISRPRTEKSAYEAFKDLIRL
jgi:hypothetical protein